LSQLDPLSSTTSVALFLEKNVFAVLSPAARSLRGVSSSPQILNGSFVPGFVSPRSFVFNDIGSFVP